MPRSVSARTSLGVADQVLGLILRAPVRARSRSYASMTSAGTRPSNRPRMPDAAVPAATTSRPPRPGQEPGMQGTGQWQAMVFARIRGSPREASGRKTRASFS